MNNDLREKVARALMEHQLWPGAFDKPQWQGHEEERTQWLKMADAALAVVEKECALQYLADEGQRWDADREAE